MSATRDTERRYCERIAALCDDADALERRLDAACAEGVAQAVHLTAIRRAVDPAAVGLVDGAALVASVEALVTEERREGAIVATVSLACGLLHMGSADELAEHVRGLERARDEAVERCDTLRAMVDGDRATLRGIADAIVFDGALIDLPAALKRWADDRDEARAVVQRIAGDLCLRAGVTPDEVRACVGELDGLRRALSGLLQDGRAAHVLRPDDVCDGVRAALVERATLRADCGRRGALGSRVRRALGLVTDASDEAVVETATTATRRAAEWMAAQQAPAVTDAAAVASLRAERDGLAARLTAHEALAAAVAACRDDWTMRALSPSERAALAALAALEAASDAWPAAGITHAGRWWHRVDGAWEDVGASLHGVEIATPADARRVMGAP